MAGRNPFSTYGRFSKNLPVVGGKTFIVVSSSSSLLTNLQDQFPVDEDGVTRVYTSLSSAVAATVSGRGDAILVMPGSYTISTMVTLANSDVKILGVGTPGAATFSGSSANILTITGDNVEVANLGFSIASTKAAIIMTGADNCDIHDNVFKSAVGGAASWFVQMLTTACTYNRIRNNQFITNLDVSGAGVTQTGHISLLGIGNLIENNVFVAGRVTTANAGAVTDGILSNTATDAGNTIRGNTFYESNGATFTAGIESGASSVSGSILPVANNFLLATAANAIVNTTGSAGFGNNIANGTV